MPPDILLVAATAHELGGHDGLVCGVGPVEAAAATARALALASPQLVVNVGLAGGRRLAPLTLVVGTEAIYHDLRVGIPVVDRIEVDATLVRAVRSTIPQVRALPIVTSATVGGVDSDAAVEAMEGFAVLRAAALAGIPAIEVRAISNEIGEEDRRRWDIPGALEVLTQTIPMVLDAFA